MCQYLKIALHFVDRLNNVFPKKHLLQRTHHRSSSQASQATQSSRKSFTLGIAARSSKILEHSFKVFNALTNFSKELKEIMWSAEEFL